MSSYNNDPIVPAGEPYVPAVNNDAPYDSLAANTDATATDRAKDAAASVAGPASDVKDTAVAAGKDVKDSAVAATKDVAGTAKAEAGQVIDEAKYHGRALLDQSMGELKTQANDVQNRIAAVVRSLSDELGAMASAPEANGPIAQFAGTGQRIGADAAAFLENKDFDEVVTNVRRYAARNPWTFLAVAGGIGLVAGRLARGLKDAEQPAQLTSYRTGYDAPQQTRSLYMGQEPADPYGVQTRAEDLSASPVTERDGEWGRA